MCIGAPSSSAARTAAAVRPAARASGARASGAGGGRSSPPSASPPSRARHRLAVAADALRLVAGEHLGDLRGDHVVDRVAVELDRRPRRSGRPPRPRAPARPACGGRGSAPGMGRSWPLRLAFLPAIEARAAPPQARRPGTDGGRDGVCRRNNRRCDEMGKKNKVIPKKIAGFKVPKAVRKSRLLRSLLREPARARDRRQRFDGRRGGRGDRARRRARGDLRRHRHRGATGCPHGRAGYGDAMESAADAVMDVIADAARSMVPEKKAAAQGPQGPRRQAT